MKIKFFGKEFVIDKATVLKWTMIGGGGLLALGGEWIDRHLKDKRFEEEVDKQISGKIGKLEERWMKEKNDEEIRKKAAEFIVDKMVGEDEN